MNCYNARLVDSRDEAHAAIMRLWDIYLDEINRANVEAERLRLVISQLSSELGVSDSEVMRLLEKVNNYRVVSEILYRAWCGDDITEEEAELVNDTFEVCNEDGGIEQAIESMHDDRAAAEQDLPF